MLSDSRVYAALPAVDFERAKNFYKEKVGLSPSEERPGGAFYDLGENSRFLLFPSAGKASGDHTQVSFLVSDIEAEVKDLKAKGIEFQEYDMPELKTENSIAQIGPSRAAWFLDSEGNVVALFQEE